MKKQVVLLVLVAGLSLASCAQFFNSFLNMTVLGTIWEIECVPNDMYSGSAPVKPSLLLNIKVYFEEDLKAKHIESVRAYMSRHPEISYEIDVNRYFNEKEHYLGGLTRFWLEEDINEIQLGTMFIEITLKGGREILAITEINAHGLLTEGEGRMYNADEVTREHSDFSHRASLRRVVVESMSIDNNRVTTTFRSKQDGTGNGWIVFYDWTGSYVGTSELFLDQRSYTSSECFTLPYYNFDGLNTIVLAKDNIFRNDGAALTDVELNSIRHCRIITVNNAQQFFVDNPLHVYSCKAYSEYY